MDLEINVAINVDECINFARLIIYYQVTLYSDDGEK